MSTGRITILGCGVSDVNAIEAQKYSLGQGRKQNLLTSRCTGFAYESPDTDIVASSRQDAKSYSRASVRSSSQQRDSQPMNASNE